MSEKTQQQAQGMVDVTAKESTQRVAVASSTIIMGAKAFDALINGQSPKGNVIEAARIAGVMAAKLTPNIIPLCHPLEIGKIKVSFDLDKNKYHVTTKAEVVYVGKTGVEMEALTAVSAAALTIYDMMKWCDKSMTITDVKLLHKSGGKNGDYHR